MTNQEVYEEMCEKAHKYDELKEKYEKLECSYNELLIGYEKLQVQNTKLSAIVKEYYELQESVINDIVKRVGKVMFNRNE